MGTDPMEYGEPTVEELVAAHHPKIGSAYAEEPARRGPYASIPATRWDVVRDHEGNAVTITPLQCSAILHALAVYTEVSKEPGTQPVFDSRTALDILRFINHKSALMGRMLYEGRPPLDLPPPTTHMAAPAWHLYDADLCPGCFGLRVEPARVVEVGLEPIPGGYQRHERLCERDWHPSANAGQGQS